MRWRRVTAAVALAAVGCAGGGMGPERPSLAPEELLVGTALAGISEAAPELADTEVLAVSPEMEAFLAAHVHRRAGPQVRLQELIDAIIDADGFGLHFDDRTRTAAATFRERRGNCLSFSNLFVALAREVGLDASFQEVELPPDWSLDQDVFVLNRHVNVHLDLGELGEHVVDFNIDDFRSSYDTRIISDARARAHFFNNRGVEHLQAGATGAALAAFRTALEEGDRSFSPAWTNLGTLYLRTGHPVHAEACYRQALEADRGDTVAMSNLVRLYERQGRHELAADYRRVVTRHRNRNPYYRYQLASEAFEKAEYRAAIGHLRYAIRREDGVDRFYHLLALCYLAIGDEGRARRALARAEEVADSEAARARDSQKIERLLSESGSRPPGGAW